MKILIPLLFVLSFVSAGQLEPRFYKKRYFELGYPYVDIQYGVDNEFQVLNNGLGSLAKRLEMIEAAQEEIILEYFIFIPTEKSSMVLIRKLMDKALQDVKIKILVDKSETVFKFDKYFVNAIHEELGDKKDNFEVRFYHNSSFLKLQLSSANFRNHRKLFLVDPNTDNAQAITGGRNIEDLYFDMSKEYNFHDRDVWLKGPIVEPMYDSFVNFWNHDITERYKKPIIKKCPISMLAITQLCESKKKVSTRNKKLNKFKSFLRSRELDDLYQSIRVVGGNNLKKAPIRICRNTTFVSDKPGADFIERMDFDNFKEDFIVVERALGEFIFSADKSVIIASPYFLLNDRADAVREHIVEKGIDVQVYTNSLNSTDAFYVASLFYDNAFDWAQKGIKMYLHGGKYIENENEVLDTQVRNAVWGLHSKTFLFDDHKVYIGTYNVDNRSAFYNTEMGVFCSDNEEIFSDVANSIYQRAFQNGIRILKENGKKKGYNSQGEEVDIYADAERRKVILNNKLDKILKPFEFLM